MAIEVRIPTILRTYTDGAKNVEGKGETLAGLIDDLESRHTGLRDRLIESGDLRKFVNIYVNDEDARFKGGLGASLDDGDVVTVLPAVAGGAGSDAVAGGAGSDAFAGGAGRAVRVGSSVPAVR